MGFYWVSKNATRTNVFFLLSLVSLSLQLIWLPFPEQLTHSIRHALVVAV